MSILCKLGIHRWKPVVKQVPLLESTGYEICTRCGKVRYIEYLWWEKISHSLDFKSAELLKARVKESEKYFYLL